MSDEYIKKYDKKGNLVYHKNCIGELWSKYDRRCNQIYFKTSYGYEYWYKYDKNNYPINITEKEFLIISQSCKKSDNKR